MSRPRPKHEPLPFVLLEDQRHGLGDIRLCRWRRRRCGTTAHQDRTDPGDDAGNSHRRPPRTVRGRMLTLGARRYSTLLSRTTPGPPGAGLGPVLIVRRNGWL